MTNARLGPSGGTSAIARIIADAKAIARPRDVPDAMRRRLLASGLAVVALPACSHVPSSDTGAAPGADRTIPVFKNEAARERYMRAYDAVLSEWPVPYESLRLPTRYGATHVVASGPLAAPPVLLLPALMTTATSWRPNVGAISRHFRTYAIDVIGEINKSEPTRPLRNERDCSDWLSDVLDALQIERAHLIGASLGGFFALNQAVNTPQRVDRVVLIGPAGVLPMTWKLWFYAGLAAIGVEGPMDAWFSNGIPFDPADAGSGVLWQANAAGRGPINSLSLGEVNEAQWRGVRSPTLLLIGDKEVIYREPPARTLESVLRRIPNLAGEIVPNANHLAARANPEFVNERIIRFLRSTERS